MSYKSKLRPTFYDYVWETVTTRWQHYLVLLWRTMIVVTEQLLQMTVPLNMCTTIEQRGIVRFLWAKDMGAKDIHKEVLPLYGEHCFWCQAVHNWVQHQCDSAKVNVLCAVSSQNIHFILLCWRNHYWHDVSDMLQLWH